MIHDKLDNWQLYFNTKPWQTVFEYLNSLSAESEECSRFSIQGDDIYASIMSYKTRSIEESVLETHDKYIDIQMSLVNSEAIDWFPREVLSIKDQYDSVLDRTFYHRPDIAPCHIKNHPCFFTVLFHNDAHMPMLMTNGKTEPVKKVVVKLIRELVF